MLVNNKHWNTHLSVSLTLNLPHCSSEVFRSLSEYEFATFYFDEKTCEIVTLIFFREMAAFIFRHLTIFLLTSVTFFKKKNIWRKLIASNGANMRGSVFRIIFLIFSRKLILLRPLQDLTGFYNCANTAYLLVICSREIAIFTLKLSDLMNFLLKVKCSKRILRKVNKNLKTDSVHCSYVILIWSSDKWQ